jgi:hypothetical protein
MGIWLSLKSSGWQASIRKWKTYCLLPKSWKATWRCDLVRKTTVWNWALLGTWKLIITLAEVILDTILQQLHWRWNERASGDLEVLTLATKMIQPQGATKEKDIVVGGQTPIGKSRSPLMRITVEQSSGSLSGRGLTSRSGLLTVSICCQVHWQFWIQALRTQWFPYIPSSAGFGNCWVESETGLQEILATVGIFILPADKALSLF